MRRVAGLIRCFLSLAILSNADAFAKYRSLQDFKAKDKSAGYNRIFFIPKNENVFFSCEPRDFTEYSTINIVVETEKEAKLKLSLKDHRNKLGPAYDIPLDPNSKIETIIPIKRAAVGIAAKKIVGIVFYADEDLKIQRIRLLDFFGE